MITKNVFVVSGLREISGARELAQLLALRMAYSDPRLRAYRNRSPHLAALATYQLQYPEALVTPYSLNTISKSNTYKIQKLQKHFLRSAIACMRYKHDFFNLIFQADLTT